MIGEGRGSRPAIESMLDETGRSRQQAAAYIALAFMAIGLTALLLPFTSEDFRRFFGPFPPLFVVSAAGATGGLCLGLLRSRAGFEVFMGRGTIRGMIVSTGVATLLGAAIVIADLFIRYPEEINVPLPEALLFYPAIGFVAEVAFHVLPLTLLLLAFSPLRKRIDSERLVWVAIAGVAVLEPTFQVLFASDLTIWARVYTWLHVFAIALCQLIVFRRHDFVSMYWFRLVYYAYWHVAWGTIRLDLLF